MIYAFPRIAVGTGKDHRVMAGRFIRRKVNAPKAEGTLPRCAILRRAPSIQTEVEGEGPRILDH